MYRAYPAAGETCINRVSSAPSRVRQGWKESRIDRGEDVSNSHAAAQLPIPDYDALPLGDLLSRLRTLDAIQLAGVLEYERQHANRVGVLTAGDARLRELRAGARPSPGSPAGRRLDTPPPPDGGSPVSPQTSGPPINPPSQGVPSNPAQPR
jgi:hypothetical protein